MRTQLFTLYLFGAMLSCAPPAPTTIVDAVVETAQINAVLDDWHDAASKADGARYFSHFTKDAIFMGTDASERWDVPAFQAYAAPIFSKGKGWTFKAVQRDITLNGASVAWFDEALETQNMGPARGSGVLVKKSGVWKIAQYNLSVPIPNEKFDAVKKLIDAPTLPQ
jgi:ketosteroid isomerase-like protein